MNLNFANFALFKYEQNPNKTDLYKIGDVVYHNESKEIGVIIQCHGNDEYRTDMFGNCSVNEIKLLGTGSNWNDLIFIRDNSKDKLITKKANVLLDNLNTASGIITRNECNNFIWNNRFTLIKSNLK